MAMTTANARMNDFYMIANSRENRPLRAQDTARLHEESVAWLQQGLKRHDPKRTVVVTHHAPSLKSEAPYHASSPLSPAFISDLGDLIEASGVPLWIHGHTHYNVDYQLGATRVLSNQRGYPQAKCEGFDPAMVVELSASGDTTGS